MCPAAIASAIAQASTAQLIGGTVAATGLASKAIADQQAKKTERAYQQRVEETEQKATAERAEFEEKLAKQAEAPSPLRLRTRRGRGTTGMGMLRVPRGGTSGAGSGAGLGMGGGTGTGLNV